METNGRRSKQHSWRGVTNGPPRRHRHEWATPESQGAFQVLALLTISCSLATLNACARKSEPGPPLGRRLTSTADDLRTGWYPNQPELDPVIVGGPSFGRLWATALPLAPGEQVFAQPLVKGNTVFLATESNDLYALDAQTGAVRAARALGTPARAADLG